ncbi:MAG: hypothetical protein ACI8PZ_004456 [Myxococcota bacterium]|jgi:hypothetical protein
MHITRRFRGVPVPDLPRFRYERWPLDRVRTDPDEPPPSDAEVERLMASFVAFGRMHPVVVSAQGELIAGRRRVAATRRLGQTQIDVAIPETQDPIALAALTGEENVARGKVSAWSMCEAVATLVAWHDDNAPRASVGHPTSDAVTMTSIGERLGLGRRSTHRYLSIWTGLTPAARTALASSPSLASYTVTQLSDLSKAEPDDQIRIAEAAHHRPLKELLTVVTPVDPPDVDRLIRTAITALEAVAAADPSWTDLLELARARAAIPVPAPEPPPEPAPEPPPAPTETPPVLAVRAALPDLGAALTTGLDALSRARRTGHSPPFTAHALGPELVAAATALAPLFGGSVIDGVLHARADTAAVLTTLAAVLAPRAARPGEADRLATHVDAVAAAHRRRDPTGARALSSDAALAADPG